MYVALQCQRNRCFSLVWGRYPQGPLSQLENTQSSPNPNGLNTNVTVSVGIADRYQLLIRRDEMVIVGPNAWYPIQTSDYSFNGSGCSDDSNFRQFREVDLKVEVACRCRPSLFDSCTQLYH